MIVEMIATFYVHDGLPAQLFLNLQDDKKPSRSTLFWSKAYYSSSLKNFSGNSTIGHWIRTVRPLKINSKLIPSIDDY
jgi:hypothetical protein